MTISSSLLRTVLIYSCCPHIITHIVSFHSQKCLSLCNKFCGHSFRRPFRVWCVPVSWSSLPHLTLHSPAKQKDPGFPLCALFLPGSLCLRCLDFNLDIPPSGTSLLAPKSGLSRFYMLPVEPVCNLSEPRCLLVPLTKYVYKGT